MTPSRRCLLLGALLASGGAAAAAAPKMSKAQARYQDQPKEVQSCAVCSLFEAPDGCKVVEGKVSPDGWCAVFAMVD